MAGLYTKKSQRITAISSAKASVYDDNTNFRVVLKESINLDPSQLWMMCCTKAILPAREKPNFAQYFWFKRISCPFNSHNATFKDKFNINDDETGDIFRYEKLFNSQNVTHNWTGEQDLYQRIYLPPSEALTWKNEGNWDLIKINTFLNSNFNLKFDFAGWENGVGVWPQQSIIYLEHKTGNDYFDLGFRGMDIENDMGYDQSQQFQICRFGRMVVERLGLDNLKEDYFPNAFAEYHENIAVKMGHSTKLLWNYLKDRHPETKYGYYILYRNYNKGSDMDLTKDYLDILFWTNLAAGESSIPLYDQNYPVPTHKGMERGFPLDPANHLFSNLPEVYSLRCNIIEPNLSSGRTDKNLANLYLQFNNNGYKRTSWLNQFEEYKELSYSSIQTNVFQTFWLQIVPNPPDLDSKEKIIHSHTRTKVGGETIIEIYITPR